MASRLNAQRPACHGQGLVISPGTNRMSAPPGPARWPAVLATPSLGASATPAAVQLDSFTARCQVPRPAWAPPLLADCLGEGGRFQSHLAHPR